MIGKGHSINGDLDHPNYIDYGSFGIFGYVVSGEIKNLNRNGVDYGTSTENNIDNVGSIVGFLENSKIQNCTAYGYIESHGWCLGGIVRKS